MLALGCSGLMGWRKQAGSWAFWALGQDRKALGCSGLLDKMGRALGRS